MWIKEGLFPAPAEQRRERSRVPWQESLRTYRIDGGEWKKMAQTRERLGARLASVVDKMPQRTTRKRKDFLPRKMQWVMGKALLLLPLLMSPNVFFCE